MLVFVINQFQAFLPKAFSLVVLSAGLLTLLSFDALPLRTIVAVVTNDPEIY
jgi:hypothetical protein